MNKEKFIEELKLLGININKKQEQQFDEFYKILIEENKKINLTRIIKKEDVYLKHFYDSLTLIKEIDLNKIEKVCDVGSGAGFPGIVLKIIFPHLKITLIDSLLKRVNYLNETVKKLELDNINAIHTRIEDHKGKYDLIVTRAVASLDKLIIWCNHLINKNNMFIAMKANIDKELENIDLILKKYKCKIININRFKLPIEESNRTLIIIKK